MRQGVLYAKQVWEQKGDWEKSAPFIADVVVYPFLFLFLFFFLLKPPENKIKKNYKKSPWEWWNDE